MRQYRVNFTLKILAESSKLHAAVTLNSGFSLGGLIDYHGTSKTVHGLNYHDLYLSVTVLDLRAKITV